VTGAAGDPEGAFLARNTSSSMSLLPAHVTILAATMKHHTGVAGLVVAWAVVALAAVVNASRAASPPAPRPVSWMLMKNSPSDLSPRE
jgi:hypothetical protein